VITFNADVASQLLANDLGRVSQQPACLLNNEWITDESGQFETCAEKNEQKNNICNLFVSSTYIQVYALAKHTVRCTK